VSHSLYAVDYDSRVPRMLIAKEGYVQGMSDLCAPLYVVMGSDEELTFWCFVEVMNRTVCFGFLL